MNAKKKLEPKHRKKQKPKKDSIELHGELLYKNRKEDPGADEVYHDPNVPGKFAGDCC